MFFGCNYNVVLATTKRRCYDVQLQRHFRNNITTFFRSILIDVSFAMLLQRRDMVERYRDLKATTLKRRHDVVCLLG